MLPAYIAAADFYVETAAPRFPEGRTWWGHRIRASATGNPFSQTGMMALASGCIPIPARRPGLDSFVPASISSLIWPAGSPEHLATMFNHAVDFTPDELARLKSECRDFALRRFDWNVNAPELERQLISLAESHYHVPASYTPVTDTSNRSPSAPFNSLTKKIH